MPQTACWPRRTQAARARRKRLQLPNDHIRLGGAASLQGREIELRGGCGRWMAGLDRARWSMNCFQMLKGFLPPQCSSHASSYAQRRTHYIPTVRMVQIHISTRERCARVSDRPCFPISVFSSGPIPFWARFCPRPPISSLSPFSNQNLLLLLRLRVSFFPLIGSPRSLSLSPLFPLLVKPPPSSSSSPLFCLLPPFPPPPPPSLSLSSE